jgi:hypothetical protein
LVPTVWFTLALPGEPPRSDCIVRAPLPDSDGRERVTRWMFWVTRGHRVLLSLHPLCTLAGDERVNSTPINSLVWREKERLGKFQGHCHSIPSTKSFVSVGSLHPKPWDNEICSPQIWHITIKEILCYERWRRLFVVMTPGHHCSTIGVPARQAWPRRPGRLQD